jgi:large subunit ribosomal protein L23
MKLTDVIRRRVITEKTTVIREDGGRWCSRWPGTPTRSTSGAPSSSCSARRSQTSHVAGARQDQAAGRFVGRRSDWKKAYVTLREGEKLPDFLQGA